MRAKYIGEIGELHVNFTVIDLFIIMINITYSFYLPINKIFHLNLLVHCVGYRYNCGIKYIRCSLCNGNYINLLCIQKN